MNDQSNQSRERKPDFKNHYHLVSGIILFKDESTGDGVGRIEMNAINKDLQKDVGVQQIQDMQRALQMNTFQRLGGPVEVVGVTIVSMNYLGHMSDKQFNNSPLEEEARLAAEATLPDTTH